MGETELEESRSSHIISVCLCFSHGRFGLPHNNISFSVLLVEADSAEEVAQSPAFFSFDRTLLLLNFFGVA